MNCRIIVFIFVVFTLLLRVEAIAETGTKATQPSTTAIPSSSLQQDTQSTDAALLFERRCYSCHNIGQGDKKGPDLKGVTDTREAEWLQSYILSPATMLSNGDPATIELFKEYAPEEMPDQALSSIEINMLLSFIAELTRTNKPFIPAGARLSRDPVPDDIPLGRNLFTGEQPFQENIPACIGCHHITGVGVLGGGTLGPDLTDANTRYSVSELINIMKYPNFPLMSKIFAGKEINDEEIVKLIAYLQDANAELSGVRSESLNLLYWGIGLTLLLFFLSSWIWRNRIRPVQRTLYDEVYRPWRAKDVTSLLNPATEDSSATLSTVEKFHTHRRSE